MVNKMKTYLGTKLVKAKPMSLLDYYKYIMFHPIDKVEDEGGYLVECMDEINPNHEYHKGEISWYPDEQLNNAYQDIHESMSFGHALECMKMGMKVSHKNWSGHRFLWIRSIDGRLSHSQTVCNQSDFETFNVNNIDMLSNNWVVVDE